MSSAAFRERVERRALKRTARGFSDWLLSPSLYPSEERLLSKAVEERKFAGFEGSVFKIATDLCSYTFLCPKEGFLRRPWPRLKHQILGLNRKSIGRLRGVRFLRTVGELPIWLDDEPRKLTLRTRAPRNAEILCVVERRVSHSVHLEEMLERGISREELEGIGELLSGLVSLKVAVAQPERVVTSLPTADIPYLLALRNEFSQVKLQYASLPTPNLVKNHYADGSKGWSFESPQDATREELFFGIVMRYGLAFGERLRSAMKEELSGRMTALLGYTIALRENLPALLRPAATELFLSGVGRKFAVVAVSKSGTFGEELAEVIESRHYAVDTADDTDLLFTDCRFPAVFSVKRPDGLQLMEFIRALSDRGVKPIIVQETGVEAGGILEVSSGLNPEDQALQALQGISSLLRSPV